MKISIIGNQKVDHIDIDYMSFYKQVHFLLKGNIYIDEIVADESTILGKYAMQYARANKHKFRSSTGLTLIDQCDRVITFWDYKSRKVKPLIDAARLGNKLLHIFLLESAVP